MKRKSILALLLMLCLVFCFTLTACGGNSSDTEEIAEEAVEETEEEIETLETIINSDSSLQEQIASGSGQEGLTIEVKDNELIYSFEMTAISDMSVEQLKDTTMVEGLDQALADGGDQFVELCSDLESQTGLEGVKITVIYTAGGDVLTSRTFDVNGVIE